MGSAETWDETTHLAVRAEQLRTLYRQTPWVFVMNPVNAAILSFALRNVVPRGTLLTWVAGMVVVMGGRVALRLAYRRASPAPDRTSVWAARFIGALAITGLGWGLGTTALYQSLDPALQLLVLFVVGGTTAGAAGTLSFYVPAFVAFATGALAPIAICLAMKGGPMPTVMAVLVVLFGVTLTLAALNTQRALCESVRLRFLNESLLQRLSRAQQSLEDANHTLEQRVAHRGAALERQSTALREAQRMEAVGLLAGGVAHDFNNLLTVIIGNISGLMRDATLAPSVKGSIEEINGAASRAAGLVKQLLAVGRRQILTPRILDVNVVLREMDAILRRLVGDTVEMTVSTPQKPALVKADPRQLEQVVLNLATNARDAMPSGGRLTVFTELVQVGPGTAHDPMGAAPGAYVLLAVTDTGMGMDAETKRQVFDPFFTTKEQGKGTGLGLATVHGIVQQSGGYIAVDSTPGAGTSFRIYLPRVIDESGAPAVERVETPMGKAAVRTDAPARILVAEDNELVRTVLTRLLRDMGHEILVGEDGEKALEVARRDGGTIDLLVTDVMMSPVGGLELAKSLQVDRPEMRLLFVSGYSWDQALPPPDPARGTDFLQKPFTPRELAAKVTMLLALQRGNSGTG